MSVFPVFILERRHQLHEPVRVPSHIFPHVFSPGPEPKEDTRWADNRHCSSRSSVGCLLSLQLPAALCFSGATRTCPEKSWYCGVVLGVEKLPAEAASRPRRLSGWG